MAFVFLKTDGLLGQNNWGVKMKKRYILALCSAALCFAITGMAQAATVSTTEITGTVEEIDSISSYSTSGITMAGMEVTVTFSDFTTETISWGSSGYGSGAEGTGWSLTMSDPSTTTYFDAYWDFDVTDSSKSVLSIALDGFANNVVFDDDVTGVGSVGSGYGNSLTIDAYTAPDTTYDGLINVSYIGGVQIAGQALVGDLYQSMLIEFAGDAFTAADEFYFLQDTDNMANPIPEPATVLLLGLGVAGLAGGRLRRKGVKK